MLKRGTLLLLWGLTLLWSFHSGRLDLLLRGVFHGLVGVTGLVLLMLGVALLLKKEKQAERWRWPWLLSGVMAALVLVLPPSPSFSDLASNRPGPARSTGVGLCSAPRTTQPHGMGALAAQPA